jgi:hypothetical protein
MSRTNVVILNGVLRLTISVDSIGFIISGGL